jgi:SAM-dependent methyltransferase
VIDNQKNIAFWDRAAGQGRFGSEFAGMLISGGKFEALHRHIGEQDRFLTIFTPTPRARVLEVGSGGGRWGFFLADKVSEYVGLDISSAMVAAAAREGQRRGLANVKFECRSLLDYPRDQKFDLIFFSGVLQYMDDDVVAQSIAFASNLMMPEGVIISRDSVQLAERVEKTGNYPVIYRTPEEYLHLFEAQGFRRDYMDLSYPPKRFTNLASRLYEVPGITFSVATAFRSLLCAIDDAMGRPSFLKTSDHKKLLVQENPREHRFFRYVRD